LAEQALGKNIKLIVGLGNPGKEYSHTRHNVGAWFVEKLAASVCTDMRPNKKLHGMLGKISINNKSILLLNPLTYMNESGRAVQAACNFYQIQTKSILIVHDELDITEGKAKLKYSGGHGGHNGLKSIISCMSGDKDFYRLRIGIGHPGHSSLVTNYVLGKPTNLQEEQIQCVISKSLDLLPDILQDNWASAVEKLHSFEA